MVTRPSAGLVNSLYGRALNSNYSGSAVSIYADNSNWSGGYYAGSSSCYFAGIGDSGYVNNFGLRINGNIASGTNNITGVSIDVTNNGSGGVVALDIVHGAVKMTLPNTNASYFIKYDPATKLLSYYS
jgi:hypothetical protein